MRYPHTGVMKAQGGSAGRMFRGGVICEEACALHHAIAREIVPSTRKMASKTAASRITVSIKHKSGRLVISCENTCSKTLNFEEMPEFLQGIGIHSVISSAEKHNGACRFSAADGLFRCTVIMDE